MVRLLLRPGLPMIVFVLALLTHGAFGPILACRIDTTERPPVATVQPAAPSVVDVAVSVVPVASPDLGSGADPCTPDRPCQHGPAEGHDADDSAVRAQDTPRAADAVTLPSLPAPQQPEPALPRPSPAAPVPLAAVLAPVAVLCVDRN